MLHLKAYAKINLALGVSSPLPAGHPRAGFHEIASWMVPLSLCDSLTVEECEASESGLELEWAPDAPRPTPIDWPTEADLTFRAWKLLESVSKAQLPVRMRLSKRIPVGGGLGGGSSDAAAALLAISTLFDLRFTRGQLRELSTSLGSDVAFFLDDFDAGPAGSRPQECQTIPRPALVSGIGERVERLDRTRSDVLLIVPPFGCPTGPVYRAFDSLLAGRVQDASYSRVQAIAKRGTLINDPGVFNDLTAAAMLVAPALRELLVNAAHALHHPVHLTGSGSCLFALAPTGMSSDLRSSWVRSVEVLGCKAIWTSIASESA